MAEDEGIRLAEPPVAIMPHRSEEESRAIGKEARAKVPRGSHAAFEPAADRPDPVSLLEEQATTRVPELVPIRYGRMLVSPFTFFRGAALIMASDLSTTPHSGLTAQICGDAHLSNFGVFGSPERQLVFDCNDFDETHPGPWEWDVKRLAASIVVAGRSRGHAKAVRADAIVGAGPDLPRVDAPDGDHVEPGGLVLPRGRVRGVSALGVPGGGLGLEVAGAHMVATATKAVDEGADEGQHEGARQADRGRRRRAPHHQRPSAARPRRRGVSGDGGRTVRQDVPRDLAPVPATLVDRPPPTAGGVPLQPDGPQGRRGGQRGHPGLGRSSCDGAGEEDVLFLQAKEAEASVLERFTKKSQYGNHGARVVAGPASDAGQQ